MAYIASDLRYSEMKYNFAESGLKLPVVSLDYGIISQTCDYENIKKMCFTAFDNGITHFDLANNYGRPYPGVEENFGKVLKEK